MSMYNQYFYAYTQISHSTLIHEGFGTHCDYADMITCTYNIRTQDYPVQKD